MLREVKEANLGDLQDFIIDELIKFIKDDCGHIYATFKYIKGKTSLADVLSACDGWNSYSFISKEEFDKLNNI